MFSAFLPVRELMKQHTRLVKTDKGQDEVRNRTHRLPPRPRALLIIVDGTKVADELVQAATGLGGGPALLESLIKDGFIEEVLDAEPAASPDAAAPASPDAPANASEKAYVAKAAMRRYIKVAAGALEMRALNTLVDEVRTPEDVVRVLEELRLFFESNGYEEAFTNLQAELSKA
jgi:hypothetical protein